MKLKCSFVHLTFLISCNVVVLAFPHRFTFELPDKETFCFYETLIKDEEYSIMYEVLSGGLTDVDFILTDPHEGKIAEKGRSKHDTVEFNAKIDGDYSFCFGNQFSSFSHKIILFELRSQETLREEAGIPSVQGPETTFQRLTEKIHEHLSVSEDYQTELRAKKMSDRLFVVDLVDHITLWSAVVSLLIILTVVAQVGILKGFFKENKAAYSLRTSNF